MPKSLTADALTILRKFEIAGELSGQKSITLAKADHPRPSNTTISFTYERRRYVILFDDHADDDKAYIAEQIRIIHPEMKGHVVKNPLSERTTYGMPFKGKDVYLFVEAITKRRLDSELVDRYPSISRNTLQKYIKAGYVEVNSVVQKQPKFDVSATSLIALHIPEKTDFSGHELPIIYIDDDVIVVNKPAGVLTHSKGALNDEFTVADFFRRYTTNALDTSRPGIVHRLDRDTSGVMIGARHDEAAKLLKKQFADRTVKKQYIAVVEGVPKTTEAVIDLPIGRNPSKPSTFRIDASGKPALTTYEVIASTQHLSLVKLLPKTGRTHQLRVHLQYINTPILGDRVYNVNGASDRLYLHAHRLEVTIPHSRREVFTTEIPKEFTKHFQGISDV